LPRKSNDNPSAPTPAGPQRKPKPDLYTVFLADALVAVLMGILFLFLEMQLYGFKIQGAPPVGMIDKTSMSASLCFTDAPISNLQSTLFLSP